MPTSPDRARPLARLWRHTGGYRRRALAAATASVLNKTFDLAPPFLIGAAVDIVVLGEASFFGAQLGHRLTA